MNKKDRQKLALLELATRKPRPYYCEVEYLESDGNQYIDTGIKLGSEFDVEINYTIQPTGQSVFGQRDGNVRNGILYNANLGLFFNIAGHTVSTSPFPLGQLSGRHKIRIKIDNYKGTTWVDGVKVQDNVSFTGSYVATTPLALFASNNNGTIQEYASSKVYSFKVTKGGVVVLDMLPVKDYDDVPCMYDKISTKLFYNQGTGTFTAGREIHPVEYIESTGTQYVNTGVILSSTDKVEVLAEYTGTPSAGSSYLFGTFGNSKNFGVNAIVENVFYGVWYNQGQITSPSPLAELNTKYKVLLSSNGIYINDILFNTVSGSFTGSVSSYLFWANGTSQPKSIMRLYYAKMWNNDTLVRDYIPMIDENGVGALFDKVNHTIYDNAGTGTFNHSDLEVECLDNTNLTTSQSAYLQTGVAYSSSNAYVIEQDIQIIDKGQIRFSGWNAGGAIGVNYNSRNYRDGNTDLSPKVLENSRIRATITIKASSSTMTNYEIKYAGTASTGSRGHGSIASYATLGYPLMVSTNNSNGYQYYTYGRLWSCKIYSGTSLDNLTLVRDLKPIVRNGKAGMLDTVNNVFYSSIGTNEFRFRVK